MRKEPKFSAEIKFVALSSFCLACLIIYFNLFSPLSYNDTWKEIRIPQGSTYTQGLGILKEQGLIKNELVFLVLGKITKTETRLRAGFYNLNTSMSPWKIFNRLRKGMIVEYLITIPEGSTLDDIRAKLQKKGLVDDTSWQLVKDKDFLAELGIEAPSLEGYLYPDTYNFAKGADPEDIFRMMVHRLRDNFDAQLKSRAEELGMSEKEVLTLASIIENEALYNRERPIISAVYHNRLKKKMRLQADPTVVYGIKRMQEGITRTDLKRPTPYNTYVIKGLPPGPISSPGIRSIRAALYPADVDYIFFVSKNDGTHFFSKTGEEHLKAVMLYQRNGNNKKDQTSDNSKKVIESLGH
ncbi:MAG TPA: endolytic transglycosylase MltG [Nitrospirae bacterium]|nr:putative aminodeoxychorismate lyase [bacterium BMS3Bbin08]HDH51700.1 endolytic transglycosylase MltG [Nitrospirota bacterium]HDO26261.1 endolytic transglycosylase MltG [Nitrospirota bacterium]